MDDKEDLRINSELYLALMEKDDRKVIDICSSIPKGPLHTVTIHNDTVIHIAAYHKRNDLALHLLKMVPLADSHKLTWQNNGGSTILHETGTNNRTLDAAKEMLRRAPMLLNMMNKKGETALFYAARHGKTKIFRYLHGEVQRTHQGPDLKTFLVRHDKSTILHLAILSGNYWMAYEIAAKHKYLLYEKDEDEMTPLQILSCCQIPRPPTNFFVRMIYNLIDANIDDTSQMVSPLKRMRKQKYNHEGAMNLIRLLVEKDTSWENTESRIGKRREKFHNYGKASSTAQLEEVTLTETAIRLPDTPLFLAARNGCVEIVKEILEVYPQAIEHIDQDGRNILHVAILYHQDEVFDYVIDEKYAALRLRGKIDNNGNTLLHMVGAEEINPDADLEGPAYVLRDKMKMFKKVKSICTTLDEKKLNYEKKTPEQLLHENNNKRRLEAKDWMTEGAKNYTIVAVLIATVAFAAAYTIPGGSDTNTGLPKLKRKTLFFVFTIADAISLSAALTSVIIFLNTITSKYRFKDFERNLLRKWNAGLLMLMISLVTLMVAFAATLILTISSGRKGTNITLYVLCFFPVLIFILMYLQSYKPQILNYFKRTRRTMKDILFGFKKPQPTVWYSGEQRMCALPPI